MSRLLDRPALRRERDRRPQHARFVAVGVLVALLGVALLTLSRVDSTAARSIGTRAVPRQAPPTREAALATAIVAIAATGDITL